MPRGACPSDESCDDVLDLSKIVRSRMPKHCSTMFFSGAKTGTTV